VANVENRPQLRDLQAELQNAVAGWLPGECPRDYFPHITLARGGHRQRAIPDRASRAGRRPIEGILRVQAITLYQSLPQPACGRYLPLARVALSGG
jgi:2'-5' RNA ligase